MQNKFHSRARCRFASMRKRRAFGPRKGHPWVQIRSYGKVRSGEILRQGAIGMNEAFRFIMSGSISDFGVATLPLRPDD